MLVASTDGCAYVWASGINLFQKCAFNSINKTSRVVMVMNGGFMPWMPANQHQLEVSIIKNQITGVAR